MYLRKIAACLILGAALAGCSGNSGATAFLFVPAPKDNPPPVVPAGIPCFGVGDILFRWFPNAGTAGDLGKNGILAIRAPSGDPCRAVPRENSNDVQFSPDVAPGGRRVAYVVEKPNVGYVVVVYDFDTPLNPRQAVHGPSLGVAFSSLEWSPNGQWIALTRTSVGGIQQIGVIEMPSGTFHTLTNPPQGGADHSPAWSPDLDPNRAGYQGVLVFVRDQGTTNSSFYMIGVEADPVSDGPVAELVRRERGVLVGAEEHVPAIPGGVAVVHPERLQPGIAHDPTLRVHRDHRGEHAESRLEG